MTNNLIGINGKPVPQPTLPTEDSKEKIYEVYFKNSDDTVRMKGVLVPGPNFYGIVRADGSFAGLWNIGEVESILAIDSIIED